MGLLLRKLYLYFTKDPEAVHYFPGAGGGGGGGGGVSNFFQGGGQNANFYRNPYTYLLFSRGSVNCFICVLFKRRKQNLLLCKTGGRVVLKLI